MFEKAKTKNMKTLVGTEPNQCINSQIRVY